MKPNQIAQAAADMAGALDPRWSKEALMFDRCQEQLDAELLLAPELAAELDRIDPQICARDELVELIWAAPAGSALRQFLFGIYTIRLSILSTTGRAWN
ncbi:MAG: hypothetical protein C0423_01835 [Methylibium sp.]|nr:hypothetical protein [Methylibium sp.]